MNPGGTVPAGGNAETARTNFLNNLFGVGNEDFELIALGSAEGVALNFPGSSGSITATLSGVGNAFIGNSPSFGRFATSGSQFLDNVTNGFNLSFSTAIAAFGFYGTDIGDFAGQLTLSLTNGSTQNLTVPNTLNAPGGSLLFWGIIAENASETFTSATFGNSLMGVIDGFAFDDLVIGDLQQVNPVPLPAALPLFGTGLAALSFIGWRRKRKAAAAV